MGIAERQKSERDRRVNMILDAATEVIENKGIEGATMEDIAAAAELGKSTIYNYFASKQILLAGLDLRGTRIEEAGFREAHDSGRNGLDRVIRVCHFYFDYAMEHKVCFQAKVQIGRISPETLDHLLEDTIMQEYLQALQRIHKILAVAIASGVNDGTIQPALDPSRSSLLIWCQMNGVIEITQNREKMIETILGISRTQIENDFFQALKSQLASPNFEIGGPGGFHN